MCSKHVLRNVVREAAQASVDTQIRALAVFHLVPEGAEEKSRFAGGSEGAYAMCDVGFRGASRRHRQWDSRRQDESRAHRGK